MSKNFGSGSQRKQQDYKMVDSLDCQEQKQKMSFMVRRRSNTNRNNDLDAAIQQHPKKIITGSFSLDNIDQQHNIDIQSALMIKKPLIEKIIEDQHQTHLLTTADHAPLKQIGKHAKFISPNSSSFSLHNTSNYGGTSVSLSTKPTFLIKRKIQQQNPQQPLHKSLSSTSRGRVVFVQGKDSLLQRLYDMKNMHLLSQTPGPLLPSQSDYLQANQSLAAQEQSMVPPIIEGFHQGKNTLLNQVSSLQNFDVDMQFDPTPVSSALQTIKRRKNKKPNKKNSSHIFDIYDVGSQLKEQILKKFIEGLGKKKPSKRSKSSVGGHI
ncbi:hypothetical protein FGO68_gene13696 [Halteria grandinella]|uniref:Uncharacterized protein n=1 Tax=Halteria grandinella TaxID=5974 RepID=A0A8J8T3V6_HALGN|nr:hypothetical protein FGO68_gene13696 [Halteria grandinella]